jgi:hypothetical protein
MKISQSKPCVKAPVPFVGGRRFQSLSAERSGDNTIDNKLNNINDDNNPNDPTTWYPDIKPVDVVKYFARDGVSRESIQDFLQANSIQTVQDLQTFLDDEPLEVISPLLKLLKGKARTGLYGAMEAALKRSRQTPEMILRGKLEYDASCISPNCMEIYTEGAVSVEPKKIVEPSDKASRATEFSLVLGPSGTGKTIFALQRVPQLACSEDLGQCFRVHFKTFDAVSLMTKRGITFPEAVAEIVQEIVEKRLTRGKAGKEISAIDLYLHVTLDEAGAESYSPYFSSARSILNIVDALKANMKFNFIKGVHLSVIGTGLDEITSSVLSGIETTKFRMQPWTVKKFDKFVDASYHPDKPLLKSVVRQFSILRDLITNGRCSYFIMDSTSSGQFLVTNGLRNFVPALVNTVASRYSASNGMSQLKSPRDKWEVCRSVYRHLNDATRQPNVAFFPRFDDLEDETMRDIARLLVEVHVESKNGMPVFVEPNKYSLSMSPAIGIVMANLLNAEARLSWNWEGFEINVMLSELKRVVANSEDIPKHPERPIIELPSRFPATSNASRCSIPVVNRYSVVLNGARAPYADVIAPYRLVQAKFSANPRTTKALYLKTELDKMGLLKRTVTFELQQNITSRLHLMWESLDVVPQPIKPKRLKKIEVTDRSEVYPYNTLTVPQSVEKPAVIVYDAKTRICSVAQNTFKSMSPGDQKSLIGAVQAMNELDMKTELAETVFAVFATNCDSFRIPKREKMEAFVIERKDVDWQGKLMEKAIPKDLANELRANVEILFQFY